METTDKFTAAHPNNKDSVCASKNKTRFRYKDQVVNDFK
jgi:hypothetical protein